MNKTAAISRDTMVSSQHRPLLPIKEAVGGKMTIVSRKAKFGAHKDTSNTIHELHRKALASNKTTGGRTTTTPLATV